jgi:ABC-type multidrug transport system fused ATPase/permease subunit
MVDEDNVDTLDVAAQRRLNSVVQQDVYLLSGTIRDNLRFGAAIDDATLNRAITAVQADRFIARLPRGLDTVVQAPGANFSAGERQLLAFARALAQDRPVLMLDEATSNVDSETERHLQAAVSRLMQARTAIIVAHRLSTIRKVDRIVVVDSGAVVDQGRHEDLIRRVGLYQRLAALQFGVA